MEHDRTVAVTAQRHLMDAWMPRELPRHYREPLLQLKRAGAIECLDAADRWATAASPKFNPGVIYRVQTGGAPVVYDPIARLPWGWEVEKEVAFQPTGGAWKWPEHTLPGSGTGTLADRTHARRNLYDAWRWSELKDHPKIKDMLAGLKAGGHLEIFYAPCWNQASCYRDDRGKEPYRIKAGTPLPPGFASDVWIHVDLAAAPLGKDVEWPKSLIPRVPDMERPPITSTGWHMGVDFDAEHRKLVEEMAAFKQQTKNKEEKEGMEPIKLTTVTSADGVDISKMTAEQAVAHIKPHRERIAYLKVLLADTPLDAARQEMAALQKGVDDFVAAHNAAHAQPK